MFDPLQLHKQDFSDTALIVFSGISGSGKSTALSMALQKHPHFQKSQCYAIQGSPILWNQVPDFQNSHLLIDEIHTIQDLKHCIRLLNHGNRIILASHLPSLFFLPLKVRYRVRSFKTDNSDKLLRQLLKHNAMTFSEHALSLYCKQYGHTITPLHLMKHEVKSNSLDEIIHVFKKYHTMSVSRSMRPTHVTPYWSPLSV